MTRHPIMFGAAAVMLGLSAFAHEVKETPIDPPAPPSDTPRADATRIEPSQAIGLTPSDKQQQKNLTEAFVPDAEKRPASWVGVGFQAGAGVGSFIDNRMAGQTSAMAQWKIRGMVGTRRHFGGEAAYIGGAQSVNAFGVQQGATLMNHGFEGAFRYNLFTGLLQPYATGGLGYSHYTLGNAVISTSDVDSTGDVLTLPISAGLAVKPGALILDARLTVRPAVGTTLIRNTNLSTWDVGAHAGFEF
jgi:hypothetical protein